MWSEELQKMTIKHFGEAGATMLKAVFEEADRLHQGLRLH